jgi:hypothetical protein
MYPQTWIGFMQYDQRWVIAAKSRSTPMEVGLRASFWQSEQGLKRPL